MKEFTATMQTIAIATNLPTFHIHNDVLQVLHLGSLNYALLPIAQILAESAANQITLSASSADRLALYHYVDNLNLSYLICSFITDRESVTVSGPFYLQEQNSEALIAHLNTFTYRRFTHEIAQKVVKSIQVKEAIFLTAWSHLVTQSRRWKDQGSVELITIVKDTSVGRAAPALTDTRIDENMIAVNYRFEQEIRKQIALGNRARLKQLLVPRTEEELALAQLNPVYQRRKRSSRRLTHILVSLNTIFRLAAEGAGLPPLYVHTISEDIVSRVDSITSEQASLAVIDLMIENYCNAINTAAIQNRSANIVRVQRHIINHIHEPLPLAELSEVAGLELSYLSRLFKRECGMGITGYIHTLRTNEAKWLLESTDRSLLEISESLGYQSQSYFSTVFKQYTGISPSRYRQTYSALRMEKNGESPLAP